MLSSSAPDAINIKRTRQRSMGESLKEPLKKKSLYKTEWCRTFEETGDCPYGQKCQFAHSEQELRIIDRHPRYKTEMCKTFWEKGTCPYGKRCVFIHSQEDETKNSPIRPRSISTGFEIKEQNGISLENEFEKLDLKPKPLSVTTLFEFEKDNLFPNKDSFSAPLKTPSRTDIFEFPPKSTDLEKPILIPLPNENPESVNNDLSKSFGPPGYSTPTNGNLSNSIPSSFNQKSPFNSPFKPAPGLSKPNGSVAKVLFPNQEESPRKSFPLSIPISSKTPIDDSPRKQNSLSLNLDESAKKPFPLSIPTKSSHQIHSAIPFSNSDEAFFPSSLNNGSLTAYPDSSSVFFPESFKSFSSKDPFGRSFESFKDPFGTSLDSYSKGNDIKSSFPTSFEYSQSFTFDRTRRKGYNDVWGPPKKDSFLVKNKNLVEEMEMMDEVVEALISPPTSPKI